MLRLGAGNDGFHRSVVECIALIEHLDEEDFDVFELCYWSTETTQWSTIVIDKELHLRNTKGSRTQSKAESVTVCYIENVLIECAGGVCVAYEVPLYVAWEGLLDELEHRVYGESRTIVDDSLIEQWEPHTVLLYKVFDPRIVIRLLIGELIARIGENGEPPALIPVIQLAVEGIRSRGQTSEAGHIRHQCDVTTVGERVALFSGRCPRWSC